MRVRGYTCLLMPVYQPRAERLNLSFPLTFRSDDDTVPGSCLNISSSGLLGQFVRPLDLWVMGQVSLQTGRGNLSLKARVARVIEREAALAFVLSTEAERQSVRDLVNFAATNTHLAGGMPPF